MRVLLVVGVMLGAGMLMGQATRPAEAEREVADLAGVVKGVLGKHPLVPGLWGAVVTKEGVVALGAAGVRKAGVAGGGEAVGKGDLVHLGSDTKAMTAVLIGQLIADKKLALTTTMAEAFPELKGRMNQVMSGVTVEQVMHHTAGLSANLKWGDLSASGMPVRAQRHKAVEEALMAAPLTEPGKTYAYSNVGYVVLGAIVEAKRGAAWEEVIQKELFAPLGMDSAGFGPLGGKAGEPWGHVVKEGKAEALAMDNPEVMSPAGRVHCTMADWGKFVAMFLRGEQAGVMTRETEHLLLTPAAGGTYAGGWLVAERAWGGGKVYTHAGWNTMWYCVAWMAPEKGFAVLAAANCGGEDAANACDDLCAALITGRGQ